jgi:hypothetical protein
MTDASIEILYAPLMQIEIASGGVNEIEINAPPEIEIEFSVAIPGPRGPQGETPDLSQIIGDPATDYALLYQLAKL